MDERWTARTLGHMEERLVCVAIKVDKFMLIEHREKFLLNLGTNKKYISEELMLNIIDSYDSANDLPDHRLSNRF